MKLSRALCIIGFALTLVGCENRYYAGGETTGTVVSFKQNTRRRTVMTMPQTRTSHDCDYVFSVDGVEFTKNYSGYCQYEEGEELTFYKLYDKETYEFVKYKLKRD